MTRPIASMDLAAEQAVLGPAIEDALLRVARSGQYVLGPEVAALEEQLADWLGVRHCVGVNSGTDALVIALRAAGVRPGDEVITTAFSFFATVEAILLIGAVPVFADIDPVSYTLDPAQVAARLTPRTRALLPVHLYGRSADMEALLSIARRHGLRVIEDVAQATGARWNGSSLGSLGDAGAFSFYPTKNLGCYGSGGLMTSNDADIAAQARLLREHGLNSRGEHLQVAYNSRLDAFQAAVLRCKLPEVDAWNRRRMELAAAYAAGLTDLPEVSCPETFADGRHVYHQYTLRVPAERRDALLEALNADGIVARAFYARPLHRHPATRHLAADPLPETERAAREVLCLPISPWLSDADQKRVIVALRAQFQEPSAARTAAG